MGMGIFLTWPLFGPSSIRGTVGTAGEIIRYPLPGSNVLNVINDTSLDENEYESILKIAVDPYSAVRNAYVQSRKEKVPD